MNFIFAPARAGRVYLSSLFLHVQRGRNRDVRMEAALGEEGKEGSEPREEKAKEKKSRWEDIFKGRDLVSTLCMG